MKNGSSPLMDNDRAAMILGIETATAVCGVALVHAGEIIAEDEVEERYVHAEQLLPRIDGVLQRAQKTVGDLDAVAVSIGPGSFTGLRIGLSVAKGLTAVCERPIVAVQTLTALAEHAMRHSGQTPGGTLLAAIDARRDEVYAQLFEVQLNGLVPLRQPRDMSVQAIVNDLGDRSVLVTGDGRQKVFDAAVTAGPDVAARFRLVDPMVARCNAGAVARLGERMLALGDVSDGSTLEPMYVKEFFFVNRQK
jgi:tRNA threonylcarbamoyladenosine biosynthesis protein TsaB